MSLDACIIFDFEQINGNLFRTPSRFTVAEQCSRWSPNTNSDSNKLWKWLIKSQIQAEPCRNIGYRLWRINFRCKRIKHKPTQCVRVYGRHCRAPDLLRLPSIPRHSHELKCISELNGFGVRGLNPCTVLASARSWATHEDSSEMQYFALSQQKPQRISR